MKTLDKTPPETQNTNVIEKVKEDVELFASKGYRTLVLAMREIELSEDANIDQLKAHDVEKNLTLLGVTGVEDKL